MTGGNMAEYQYIDEEEREIFEYLDELRESAVTNMFGAGPYLQRFFGMTKAEAGEYLTKWMRTFGERHPQEES
jgi:hypothetical protein